ncbi:TIGR00730 family Rossman fold protein [Streptacidiphilus pinicola]|uniref:Cytokinin riboside 5'-monophosphate phosphoribohydrolase n=1 Tax=Streptacidiphilus pinicola TaxID=2219663 RepID=A0A2X0IAS1_9ACTN|nr:TIGR00730 family Rossman fold protein [Streptacidiphilus pinicola]RAG82062.1 TIGR00730 family Rossman fold protein [Streptacidiphilus pinicola]
MNITVFCSAAALDDRYTAPARDFARALGERGHTLVWGGSFAGLMGVVADEAKAAGAKLVGISVEMLAHKAYSGADELVTTANLAERKAQLLERADALVVLVGGLGTLDEVTEVLELKKHGLHDKPVVLLDTDGFYDGMRTQLRRMDQEGFLPRPLDELVRFAPDGATALRYAEEAVDGSADDAVSASA